MYAETFPHLRDPSRAAGGLLAAALDAVADAVVIADLDGVVVHVNPAFTAVTGFTPASVLGCSSDVLLAGEGVGDLREVLAAVRAGGVWHGELRYRHHRGHAYLGRVTASPVRAGGEGVTHVLMLHRDITAFRRISEDQRRAQEHLMGLIERLPEALAVYQDGRFVQVNSTLVRLLGYARASDVTALPSGHLVHPEDRDLLRRVLEHAEPGSVGVSLRLRRRDGNAVHVETATIPLQYAGRPAIVLTARDLTRRRQLELREREMDRMIAIGTLAAGIAHEINTPIQFIGDSAHFLGTAFADLQGLLARYRAAIGALPDPPPGLREALDEAEDAADAAYAEEHAPRAIARTLDGVARVATIVRAMKEFGHPGSDSFAPADLNAALRNAVVVARNEIKYVADVELALGEIPLVVCHLGSMSQVFLNLLVNAAHAIAAKVEGTEERGTIRVATRHEGDAVQISVEDTGTGIPVAARSRVFDPFFTTKEVGRGTGQGLAIARSVVVEKHRGCIWYDTREGRGTTFHVRVPVDGPGAP